MPTKFAKSDLINLKHIAEFREQLAKVVEKEKDLYEKKDLDRIKTDDWYCQQYILHQKNNIEKAVDMAKDALQWRKTFKVHEISRETLVDEAFARASAYPYNFDKEDSSIIMLKVRLHKKEAGYPALVARKYLVYWVERLLRENDCGRITVIFDCSNSGMSNLDLELTRFIINLFKLYYPATLGYILVHEMPWLFNAAWKMIKTWLPKDAVEKIKFTNKSNIKDYVDENNLPVDMGGNDTHTFVYEDEKVRDS